VPEWRAGLFTLPCNAGLVLGEIKGQNIRTPFRDTLLMTQFYDEEGNDRGRDAKSPWHIPAIGWRDILLRVWHELKADNISMVAAAVAFYVLLALFPAITALGSLYGLLADPSDVQTQLSFLRELIPADAWTLINTQLSAVAAAGQSKLGLGALIGLWPPCGPPAPACGR